MQDNFVTPSAIREEIDRHFDDASLVANGQPKIVVLMGGPAVGKSTIRRQRYARGHVVVDAAEVFIGLCRGRVLDFPGPLEGLLEEAGSQIARRAIGERRHIVTELIGAEAEPTKALLDAMLAIGYRVDAQVISCDMQEAWRRNLDRGENNISAYFAEPYHRKWLHVAAVAAWYERTARKQG